MAWTKVLEGMLSPSLMMRRAIDYESLSLGIFDEPLRHSHPSERDDAEDGPAFGTMRLKKKPLLTGTAATPGQRWDSDGILAEPRRR